MKKFIVRFLLFTLWSATAQEPVISVRPSSGDDIGCVLYTNPFESEMLEKKPLFPGGASAFYNYIVRNITLPESEAGVEYKVRCYVAFIVMEDGTLADVKVIRDPGYGIGKQITQVVTKSPKWSPGIKDGKPVAANYSFPLTLVLPQKEGVPEYKDESTYELSKVDIPPVFADGQLSFEDYINWKIERANLADFKPGVYNVPLEIVMDNSGFITYFKVTAGQDDLKRELVRVVRRAPQWIPARLNGKKVAVRMNLIVKVTLLKL